MRINRIATSIGVHLPSVRGSVRRLLLVLWACWLPVVAGAQTLDAEMPVLAVKLTQALSAQGFRNIAAVDFTDLQGRPTELGRYLSDRLSVEMVASGGPAMLDRGNIKRLLAEHKLTAEGLIDPANAKKLGQFAGADAILIGTITTHEAKIELIVKAISTEGARIVAAGRITFPNTGDFQQPGSTLIDDSLPAGAAYEPARVIAYKDIGPLRIALTSILPTRVRGQHGRETSGMRCSFAYSNRDTKRTLFVAMNAESLPARPQGVTIGGGSTPAARLRASLIDDRGGVWTVSSSALAGMGYVRAGVYGDGGHQAYSPSDIVKLLRLRDDLGRDEDDPSDGRTDTSGGVNYTWGSGSAPPPPPKRFIPFTGNRFIAGSTTTIEPGGSLTVSMDFEAPSERAAAPQAIQFAAEVVIGTAAANKRTTYSLQNLTFDRITVPQRN